MTSSQMTGSQAILDSLLSRTWDEDRVVPAHKGVPGSEKADEWAKLAAEKPDAHGVEWLGYSD